MFGLFEKQTELEQFCNRLLPKKFLQPSKNLIKKDQDSIKIATLFLYEAGKFLSEMKRDKNLKKYCKRTNSDLIIFETIIFLHAMLSYEIMDGRYNEDETLEVLNKALIGALATIESFTAITNIEKFSVGRSYVPDMQTSTENFLLILQFCCFGNEPEPKPKFDMNQQDTKTYIGITTHVYAFAKAKISAYSNIVKKIIENEERN